MTTRRTAALLLLALTALLAGPVGAGSARTSLDAVAASLTATPVYNDANAERAMSTAETDALIADIRETGLPYYIAVLPKSTLDPQYPTANDVLAVLPDKVDRPGIYAVVVGNDFRAGSTQSPKVGDLADAAIAEYRGAGTYAVLQGFVAASAERYGGTVPTSFSQANPTGFPWILLALLGVGVAGGGFLIHRGNKKRAQRRERELRDVTGILEEDITEYGERLSAFDMSDSRLDQPARDQLEAALDSYEKAKSALAGLTSPGDAGAVTTHLEDGRYALACVAAQLNGDPMPERRPPCFIDPRHGPSTDDVMYTPAGAAAPRETPVCPRCAQAIAAGRDPAPRRVTASDGRSVPYWQGGPQYAPYAQGYYDSFGNVLPALLIGTMMGSMMSGGYAHGAEGSADGGGSGDFGGGSFGGDFGGGDIGGGSFGGDFGGGDFGGGGF